MIEKILKFFPFNIIPCKHYLRPIRLYLLKFIAAKIGINLKKWKCENYESVVAWKKQKHHIRNYFIRDKIIAFNPQSILEFGSSCGNILSLLAEKLPSSKIVGIDISPVAIECGKAWLMEDKIMNVSLEIGDAESLLKFTDESFDVVFSCATLMYIKPNNIKKLIKDMIRISQKVVILLEMNGEHNKNYLGEFYLPSNWKRNYRRIYNELGISDDRIFIEWVGEDIWKPSGGGAAYIEIVK